MFDGLLDVFDMYPEPKPHPNAFRKMMAVAGACALRAVF
jgi:hypothetical protein